MDEISFLKSFLPVCRQAFLPALGPQFGIVVPHIYIKQPIGLPSVKIDEFHIHLVLISVLQSIPEVISINCPTEAEKRPETCLKYF